MKKIKTISVVLLLIIICFSGCNEEQKPEPTDKTEREISIEFMNHILDDNLNNLL